ncbi:hypothetical protein ABH920_004406 [Catenulispora sp. EB89]
MLAAAFVTASALPHYGRGASTTGVIIFFGLFAGVAVALVLARRRR